MIRRLLLLYVLLGLNLLAGAQSAVPAKEGVFNDAVVARIDIFIHPDSLVRMLLPQNLQSDHEYPADFIWSDGIRTDTVKQVGFRLRGNTSRNSAKKSFKIKFNHFTSPKFQGLSDMNLNGEHNDPSIMRAKLSWDIMRHAGLEAPRSSYVALYINQEYRGLYLNVEHIDNDYFEARKKDADGQLFKCFYGCDFRYNGDDPKDYNTSVYAAENNKDNPDYQSLIAFIKTLNAPVDVSYRCNLEAVFNVDDYLKRLALEILTGHWDNPVFNKNNAYAYVNPATKKLEILSYDIDNTFGVDWFNVNWADRNIYSWSPSSQPRPIYTQLLKDNEYKIRFGYYIRTYCTAFFNPQFLNPKIDRLRELISPYRTGDTYASYDYGYSYDDFLRSLDISTGAHVKFGLKEYIARRSATALSQVQNTQISPVIENVVTTTGASTFTVIFNVTSLSPSKATIKVRKEGTDWTTVDCADNGVFPDATAGDGKFACVIPVEGKQKIEYIITAVDGSSRTSQLPVCGSFTTNAGFDQIPKLRINEFMADNTIIRDEAGDTDDWIELFNAGDAAHNLGNSYLTDNPLNVNKWRLPPVDLTPGAFLLIWADEDQEQGPYHASFKLSKSGEFLGIYEGPENLFAPVDTFTFDNMPANVSFGRLPDGQGSIVTLTEASPGRTNQPSGNSETNEIRFETFPNPFVEYCTISGIQSGDDILVFNPDGNNAFSCSILNNEAIVINTSKWQNGNYWLLIKRCTQHYARLLVKM
jgi:spore coat protein H